MKTLSTHYIRLIGPIGLICLIGLIGGAKTAHALSLRNTSNNLGLVAYYSLNDGTSTKATDFSGNGNTGTLTNFALTGTTSNWVDGKKSKALAFDGTNDHIAIGDISALNVETGSFTVSAWVKVAVQPVNDAAVIVGKGTGGQGGFGFAYFHTGGIYVLDLVKYGVIDQNVSYTLTTGVWYHLVAVQTVGTSVQYFVNGASVGTYSNATAYNTAAGRNFVIGAMANGVGSPWNGTLDDVRIYNRALSATEIANMYNSGIAKVTGANDTGLVAYYPMDEGKGTVAGDSSGNRNTGTLTNGPTWTAGRRGKAINFDGSNDGVGFGGPVLTNTFTVSLWLYPIPSSAGYAPLLIQNGSLGIYYHSNSVISYYYSSADHNSNIGLTENAWNHVVVVNDAGSLTYYNNAVAAGSYSSAPGFTLNAMGANGAELLKGSLDDVRIYSRALSATEVLNLYNATKVGATRVMTVSDTGLVGYWSLDDGTSTKATDFSGNGNTGTLTNFALTGTTSNWVTGKRGKGLDFDGSNDFVNIPNSSSTDFSTGDFTVSAWAKSTTPSTQQWILMKRNSNFYGLNFGRSGSATAGFFLRGTLTDVILDGPSNIAANTWYHVVGVRSGNNSYLYVNSVLANSSSNAAGSVSNIGDLAIGQQGTNQNTQYWNGSIDEVRIYNRVLTATEVQTLYNIGR